MHEMATTTPLPTQSTHTDSKAPPQIHEVPTIRVESAPEVQISRSDPNTVKRNAELKTKRKNRYSEIYSGPRTFGSFLVRSRFHLTLRVDRRYFTGRAGLMRIFTLMVALISLGLGMPGFSPTPKLYIGYGASPLIWISLIIFSICIILSIWFIFMLLLYREVRCQIKWDQWNMNTNVCCCILAASAGLLELFGIFQAKMFNCQDPRFGCAPRNRIFKSPPRKLLDMPYKQLHYASCLGKIFCAVLYSVCSRALLKNNDQVEG